MLLSKLLRSKSQHHMRVTSRHWRVLTSSPFELMLAHEDTETIGWYKITLTADNASAVQWLAERGKIFVQQNHNTHVVDLLQLKENKLTLVFLRHNPLKTLSFLWHHSLIEGALFTIKIKPVSQVSAWLHMLRFVSRQDKAYNRDWTQIYRKTRARTKRSSSQIALQKLVAAYHPLLQHQLISCEPYSYWRQHREPELLQPYLTQSVSDNSQPVDIVLKSKQDQRALIRTLQSIVSQRHHNWRVHIVQFSQLPECELEQLLAQEKRILLCHDPEPSPFIDNSWLMFLQEGDLLPNVALSAFIYTATRHPQAKILYADHDLLTKSLLRVAPHFKPTWSPDLLCSQNYIGPAYIVKAELLREECNNPQWWKQHYFVLLLKALLQISAKEKNAAVQHIALSLFHQSQKNVKQGYSKHTQSQLLDLLAEFAFSEGDQIYKIRSEKTHGLFHIRYKIPRPLPLVSLLIPTRDALEITRQCVESIMEKTSYPHYEILILDNQSEHVETLQWFEQISQHPKVRVIRYDHPFNYSAINNFGVRHAEGTVIGLINNDTQVINPTWLTEMVQHACRPEIGCVGAKLYYFDDTIQHAGVVLGLWGLAGHSHKNYPRYDNGYQRRLSSVQNVSAVTAACLLVRKELYLQVRGLDEANLSVSFNDVDFCLKVQNAGYRNIWTPHAELYHYESKTRGKEDTPEKKARELSEILYMRNKWIDLIQNDPYYNPNLTRVREDFSLQIE